MLVKRLLSKSSSPISRKGPMARKIALLMRMSIPSNRCRVSLTARSSSGRSEVSQVRARTPAPAARHSASTLARLLRVDVEESEIRAAPREQLGGGRADASRSSADDDHFPVQVHVASPVRIVSMLTRPFRKIRLPGRWHVPIGVKLQVNRCLAGITSQRFVHLQHHATSSSPKPIETLAVISSLGNARQG